MLFTVCAIKYGWFLLLVDLNVGAKYWVHLDEGDFHFWCIYFGCISLGCNLIWVHFTWVQFNMGAFHYMEPFWKTYKTFSHSLSYRKIFCFKKIYNFLFNYNIHSFLRYTEQKERYGTFILWCVLSRKYLNCEVEIDEINYFYVVFV